MPGVRSCGVVRCFALSLSALLPLRAEGQANWPMFNGDYASNRYSMLRQITPANAANLRRACVFDTGEKMAAQSGPVVVDGTLYFTTDTSTYAIDARTCEVKWRRGRSYAPLTPLGNNHGVAYMDGRLYRVSGDVHAYALDARTGEILWDVAFGDPKIGETAPMAPIAWNGMVFVGNAGGDNMGVRGHVHALDAQTGKQVWRFEVIPDTGAARRTWGSGARTAPPTGGGMWSSFTLDTVRRVLYVPTGNPAPDFMPQLRPGDNLYTNSVIALDPTTGRFIGYHQAIKDDYHDWDVSATPALITTRNGRTLLAVAGKDGMLYGIRRANDSDRLWHQWSVPTTTRQNTEAPLTHERPTRFCPGTQGGTEWNGPAYNPRLNLIYVGAVDWCTSIRLVHPDSVRFPLSRDFTGHIDGGFGDFDPKDRWQGWITAFEADSATVRWKYRSPTPILAGITTTAGNIVITGDMNGNLIVLDGTDGRVLYQHDVGASIGGGVITYEVSGKQYIAVNAGSISPIWPLPERPARLVIYALP